jgi:hypothetical protein
MTKRDDAMEFVAWWRSLSDQARAALLRGWEGSVPPEVAGELWTGDNSFTTWGQVGDGPRLVYVKEKWWPFIERRAQSDVPRRRARA